MKVVGSMYDPYRELITKMCAEGYTCKEICDRIGEGYNPINLNQYIHKRGIIHDAETVYGRRPKCNKCEYCIEVTNNMGNLTRVCLKSKKTIQAAVVYSPKWCERKGEND